VIDRDALQMLVDHREQMDATAKRIQQTPMPVGAEHGTFFAPTAYEIDGIKVLQREVFGPVLHVVRYDDARLDAVIDDINGAGFGLTLCVHSRIDATVRYICDRLRVGNAYVNRNQIGAVVGVQPFGGEGLSGTGPKAGGPHYLPRFATERARSTDITASGGNAALLNLEDDPLSGPGVDAAG
jgi:RHH-type proline utilization regulon transcriptional repressor/proline dehydrogenase/delta 1-pyrroline-5-carboxylate dehydrogenase